MHHAKAGTYTPQTKVCAVVAALLRFGRGDGDMNFGEFHSLLYFDWSPKFRINSNIRIDIYSAIPICADKLSLFCVI